MKNSYFIEVGHQQQSKAASPVCGDVFFSLKTPEEDRTIIVLADGLGSGIKASVLATITATMAARFMSNNINPQKAAKIIMDTLPVCSERKIAYSTFTIVDMNESGHTKIVEYDNPSFLLIRNQTIIEVEKKSYHFDSPTLGPVMIQTADFQAYPEDRIVFFSDGVDQSGMGTKAFPMGWGLKNAADYLLFCLKETPTLSAAELADKLVRKAIGNNGFHANDDITCGVVYARKPRNLLVFSGPPYDQANDVQLKDAFMNFDGQKIICGGTTAKILSRELERSLQIRLDTARSSIPPISRMDGFALITEGTITLSHVAQELITDNLNLTRDNAISKLLTLLLNSDIIYFLIGTRINEAHQDPNLPENLDIRRNIIKRIASILQEKYLKKVVLKYI